MVFRAGLRRELGHALPLLHRGAGLQLVVRVADQQLNVAGLRHCQGELVSCTDGRAVGWRGRTAGEQAVIFAGVVRIGCLGTVPCAERVQYPPRCTHRPCTLVHGPTAGGVCRGGCAGWAGRWGRGGHLRVPQQRRRGPRLPRRAPPRAAGTTGLDAAGRRAPEPAAGQRARAFVYSPY